ncbi:MAG: sulfite exporter TauE/SafE family protein [Planctomycetes bacterium]|nr:sulfite exporter TauE/SafE family protein [Planctomycetota bacterium]MBL7041704.1 sulfite exporter TauE/SafE family protein [Pirellulaceae bacterium]
MDDATLGALIGTAAAIGFIHTLTGPDHFVPFIAMARVGQWSLRRTMAITFACGLGHVLSSIVLGALGIGLGWMVGSVVPVEEYRGNVAGWLLLGFGLAYMTWGLVRAIRNRPHGHSHGHTDGAVHVHEHTHHGNHVHVHEEERAGSMTPWVLFAIFVFGPCEPLIPILMYPAAKLSLFGVGMVTIVFAVATLATMLTIVVAAYLGLAKFSFPRLQRFSHAIAGGTIALCGAAIQLGL